MKRINKIFLIYISFLLINIPVKAEQSGYTFNAGTDSTGQSTSLTLSSCTINDTCLSIGAGFNIRVTLIDKNRNIVKNTDEKTTRTVQFMPYQPADKNGNEQGVYYLYDIPDGANKIYNGTNGRCYKDGTQYICIYPASNKKDATWIKVGTGKEENFLFLGSDMTTHGFRNMYPIEKTNGKLIDEPYMKNGLEIIPNYAGQFCTYLGFGMNKTMNQYDVNNYPALRKNFVNYATNLSSKLNYVSEENKYVSFIDYFLHVSGFSESWTAMEDDQKAYEQLASGQYYLIVEPVYTIGTNYDGYWHTVTGTAKQIAGFTEANYYDSWCSEYGGLCRNSSAYTRTNFAAGYDKEFLYNMFCNFMDNATKIPFTRKYAANANKACDDVFKRSYNRAIDEYNGMLELLDTLKDPESPYGVSIIDITALITKIDPPSSSKYAEGAVNVSYCENNSMNFSAELTARRGNDTNKPFEKKSSEIYYFINSMSDEDKEKYLYKVETAGENIYCYDDVNYDFNSVKNALQKKTYNSGTMVEVPSGELTVNRYCYSKKQVTDKSTLQMILSDNIENKNYQDKFEFNFNGEKYSFKRQNERNNSVTITDPIAVKEGKFATSAYLYSSTFSYDYILDNSISSSNAFIDISTYELKTIESPNSIKFISNFDNSNMVFVPIIDEKQHEFDNSINGQIKNGYGLSTKMVENIKQNSTIVNDSESEQTIKNTISTTTSLLLNEDKNKSCSFKTEVTNGVICNGNCGTTGTNEKAQFRVISLNNPFPARDGTSRLPGSNWLNEMDNNVYEYIQNNRNVKNDNKNNDAESVYKKEPLYTITLTPSTMVKIREYNKSHNYSNIDMTCESGTGRMCIDNFIRNSKYIPELNGTCKTLTTKEITEFNNRIREFELSGCNNQTQCMTMKQNIVNELDTNKDGYVTSSDYLNADFYTCADKTYRSGG